MVMLGKLIAASLVFLLTSGGALEVGDEVTVVAYGPSKGMQGQVLSLDVAGNPTVQLSAGPPPITAIFLSDAVQVLGAPATAGHSALPAISLAASVASSSASGQTASVASAAAGPASSASGQPSSAASSASSSAASGASSHSWVGGQELRPLDEHSRRQPNYEPTAAGKLCGFFVVGTVAFIMAIYYAVNWWQRKPRMFAWKMISATISIFLSVMTFSCCERLLLGITWLPEEAWKVLSFFIFYAFLQLSLRLLIENPLTLTAIGTCCGHMAGFAAISAFEGIQANILEGIQAKGIQAKIQDELTIFVVCLAFGAVMGTVLCFGTWLRQNKEEELGHRKGEEAVDMWMEQCVEAEDDAFCLAMGLLASQFVRYQILGFLPPLSGYPAGKTRSQIHSMQISVMVFSVLLLLSTYVTKQIMKRDSFLFVPSARIVRIVQGTLAMTLTWLVIFWTQWEYYYDHRQDKLIMKTILAVIISAAVFPALSVISLHCVANSGVEAKALKAIVNALGLLVGLSWEKAFDFSIREVVLGDANGAHYMWSMILWTVGMDLIVGIAWAYFILPQADPEVQGHGGAKALWGDMMQQDSLEDSSDEEGSGHKVVEKSSEDHDGSASE
mmetsp:Transcript_63960/g.183735  ORF Transcript_63960/g.183735 Transcript_63960/m.183735 type:complete len:614 (-) Transcript_63960:122-1963(-)